MNTHKSPLSYAALSMFLTLGFGLSCANSNANSTEPIFGEILQSYESDHLKYQQHLKFSVGKNVANPFYSSWGFSAGYNRRLAKWFGVGGNFEFHHSQDNGFLESVLGDSSQLSVLSFKPKTAFGISTEFVPFSGLINFFESKVVNFELPIEVALQKTQFEPVTPSTTIALRVDARFIFKNNLGLGLGQAIYWDFFTQFPVSNRNYTEFAVYAFF